MNNQIHTLTSESHLFGAGPALHRMVRQDHHSCAQLTTAFEIRLPTKQKQKQTKQTNSYKQTNKQTKTHKIHKIHKMCRKQNRKFSFFTLKRTTHPGTVNHSRTLTWTQKLWRFTCWWEVRPASPPPLAPGEVHCSKHSTSWQSRLERIGWKIGLYTKFAFFMFFLFGKGKEETLLIVLEGLATLRGLVVGRQKEKSFECQHYLQVRTSTSQMTS